MYGTVARIKVKAGSEDDLKNYFDHMGAVSANGFVASAVYKADTGGQEYWLAVIFADQASYRANAESPEQNARYEAMRSLLEADPEWHDGEVVGRYLAGG